LRVFAHLPGGDRERGLSLIEEAREGAVLHGTEVRVQLYEIYAWHERRPDRALAEIRALRRRYRGWPFWALKLAEHLRDRMGLYADSADVARALMESEERRAEGRGGVAADMARVSLGESLLLDLRLSDARQVLLPVRDGPPDAPEVGQRARLLLGRALELEGDREAAEPHYRRAVAGPDRQLRKETQAALAQPLSGDEVRASHLLAEARRLRERGRREEAADVYRQALRLWPRSQEAALRVAEDDLRLGRRERAAETVDKLTRETEPAPPWVRPWSWLLRAQLLDLSGERSAAVALYRRVLDQPHGQDELSERAAEGLRRPFAVDGRSRVGR
jgi:tetratricopeptide (TPR) repeat protein